MSIKRWHAYIEDDDGNDLFVSHQQDAQGQWVRYDDHVAEVVRLQARERELEAALRDVINTPVASASALFAALDRAGRTLAAVSAEKED